MAKLSKYPTRIKLESPETLSISFPDMHGNAIKLLYYLIQQGILEVNEDDYTKLVGIYLTPTKEITAPQLDTFSTILTKAKTNPIARLYLIGDLLADRGRNDWFTFQILKKLSEDKINTDILFSNHDLYFLMGMVRPNTRYKGLRGGQSRSFEELGVLTEKKIVNEEATKALVNDHYKKMLKLLDYSVYDKSSPPCLTLYTHAPAGLEAVKAFATCYGVTYDDKDISSLTKTIDSINACFQDEIINRPHIFALRMEREQMMALTQHYRDSKNCPKTEHYGVNTPFLYVAWNRDTDKAEGPPLTNTQYTLRNEHGHAGPTIPQNWTNEKNIRGLNLDANNAFGFSDAEEEAKKAAPEAPKPFIGFGCEGRPGYSSKRDTPAPKVAGEEKTSHHVDKGFNEEVTHLLTALLTPYREKKAKTKAKKLEMLETYLGLIKETSSVQETTAYFTFALRIALQRTKPGFLEKSAMGNKIRTLLQVETAYPRIRAHIFKPFGSNGTTYRDIRAVSVVPDLIHLKGDSLQELDKANEEYFSSTHRTRNLKEIDPLLIKPTETTKKAGPTPKAK